jgi:hypothetical protein
VENRLSSKPRDLPRFILEEVGMMTRTSRVPSENIESANEYVGLLCEALDEAAQTIEQEMSTPS